MPRMVSASSPSASMIAIAAATTSSRLISGGRPPLARCARVPARLRAGSHQFVT
jgi:hypothetical protein